MNLQLNYNHMKTLLITFSLLSMSLISAQTFEGKGDQKLQIGANFQNNATGIMMTYDYGLGQNISVGLVGGYALGINNDIDADFNERINLRARFNANIGSVLNIGENIDVYPGINLSMKNFGGHLGFRYFLSDGFGVFSEIETPFASYKSSPLTPGEKIHNQFAFNIGAVFNL